MRDNFIHLSHGVAINVDAITHIDFRKPVVSICLGSNSVEAKGDDAAYLREEFEPTAEERATKVKERAAKKAVAEKKAADAKKTATDKAEDEKPK
jgi:hypothetical protein